MYWEKPRFGRENSEYKLNPSCKILIEKKWLFFLQIWKISIFSIFKQFWAFPNILKKFWIFQILLKIQIFYKIWSRKLEIFFVNFELLQIL